MYDHPSLLPPEPIAAGYTKNHAQYPNQNKMWACKAFGVKEEVSIQVVMGHIPSGKRNIKQIGVRNDRSMIKCLCAHTYRSQYVVEGFNGVDAHIRGDDLHQ